MLAGGRAQLECLWLTPSHPMTQWPGWQWTQFGVCYRSSGLTRGLKFVLCAPLHCDLLLPVSREGRGLRYFSFDAVRERPRHAENLPSNNSVLSCSTSPLLTLGIRPFFAKEKCLVYCRTYSSSPWTAPTQCQ